ncbi:hypothetical protein [Sphingomonas swuensis]|uniref:hypothetical protein n=1 Tax=Sphingomonas swuensis TaxID=977800 RepID=UPI0031D92F2E
MSDRAVNPNARTPSLERCLELAEAAEREAARATLPNLRAKHLANAKSWRRLATITKAADEVSASIADNLESSKVD